MPPGPGKTRHVSIRVPDELFRRLDTLAAERDETVSQCARRLLVDGLEARGGSAGAIDQAIAALRLVGRQVAAGPVAPHDAPPAAPRDAPPEAPVHEPHDAPLDPLPDEPSPSRPPAPSPSRAEPAGSVDAGRATPTRRAVNVHNAKTNLSRLLADVGRGDEIVIVHAGNARALLVPVGDGDAPVDDRPARSA